MKGRFIAGLCFFAAVAVLAVFPFVRAEEQDIEVKNAAALEDFSGDLAKQIGEAYQLAGLSDVVRGKMSEKLNSALQAKLQEFSAEAFQDLAKSSGKHKGKDGKTSLNSILKDANTSPETKAKLQAKCKEKLKNWLPTAVKDLVENELLGGLIGEEALGEFKQIEEKIVGALNTSLNDKIDEIGERWYGEAIDNLNSYVSPCKEGQTNGLCGHFSLNVDVTDLKGTFNSAFSLKNTAGLLTYPMANAFGESTVRGIQDRIETAFSGQLPPEAMKYLKMGPDKFRDYADKAKSYLPNSKLKEYKNKLYGIPLMKLPNGAYGGILAGVSATHFGKGLVGCPLSCDWFEINRGREVAQVLVWQLRNKEAVSLTLGNFLDLAKMVASKYGLDKLGGVAKLKADLDKLSGRINKIDKMVRQPIDKMQGALDKTVKELQDELLKLQDELLGPLKDFKEGLGGEFAKVQGKFGGALGNFNGLPGSFRDLRKKAGVPDDIFGKLGDFNPLKEGKKWAKKHLAKIAQKMFGADKAKLGSKAAAAKGVLGPDAEIKKEEKIPAKNESSNNAFDPVLLHSGEFYHRAVDLEIPGRGIDFRFARIYRSSGDFRGILGNNWTHSYAERVIAWDDSPEGKGVTWVDAEGKKYFFKEKDSGFEPVKTDSVIILPKYESPKGVFSVLYEVVTADGEEYVLRSPNGDQSVFDAYGFLAAKKDRFGNELKFTYGGRMEMTGVIDTLGREIGFSYDTAGRLESVRDFAGRILKYSYDKDGNLAAATDVAGNATKYSYSGRLMTQITDKKGQVYLKNVYGTVGDNAGKVVEQVYGDDKFHISAEYRGPRVWVLDKLGVMRVYDHNDAGGLICEWIIEDGRAVPIVWHYYDENNLRTETGYPSGKRVRREFAGGNLTREEICREKCRTIEIAYEPAFNSIASLKDAAGGEYKLEYNASGALAKAVLPDGSEVKFENDGYGRRISKTSAGGIVDRYEYGDYLKRIVKDAGGLNASWSFDYDRHGFLVAVTGPGGRRKEFFTDKMGRVLSESSDGGLKRYIYDANGNMAKSEWNGRAVEYAYDILDKIISKREKISDGKFAETRYGYDANENLVKVTLPEGNVLNYSYDIRGRLIQTGKVKYEYDNDGMVRAVTNGVGAIAKFEYNDFGEVVSAVDQLGFERCVERDLLGRVVADVTLLNESRYAYDPRGNMTERRRKLWQGDPEKFSWVEEKMVFDADDKPIEFIDANGARFKYAYDGLGRVIAKTDPLGNVRKYFYSVDGLLLKDVSGALETAYSYDTAGRLVSKTDALGNVVRYFYDEFGNLVRKTDPAGFSVGYKYDGLARPTEFLEEAGGGKTIRTAYEWNGNGGLSALIDDNGNRTRFKYDELDRLVREEFVDGTTNDYRYDSADNLIGMSDPNGNSIVNSYDAAGNLIARNHFKTPSPLVLARQSFGGGEGRGEGGTVIQEFAYDGLSRLVYSADHGKAKIWYAYDSLSRLAGENQNGRWVVRNYDSAGNKTAVMYPSQDAVYKNYDPLGRLAGVNGVAEFEYDGTDRLSGVAFENGARLSQKHDKLNRVIERFYNSGAEKLGWRYRHDSRGNLISDGVNEYGYDGASRLVKAGGAGTTETWTLDGVGNWVDKYEPNSMNAYKGFEYDKNGNLTGDGNLKYGYDPLNRLVSVARKDGTEVANYEYDVHNRRTSKISVAGQQPAAQSYFYDGWDLIEEYFGALPSRQFVYGQNIDEPIMMKLKESASAPAYYFMSDRLGSIRALADQSGRIVERRDYSAYGVSDADAQSPKHMSAFSFTARELDVETGLIYFRNRYYSPKMGRFITRDPLGFVDGPNMYAYVGNRPLNAVDPLGLFSFRWHEEVTRTSFARQGVGNVEIAAVLGNWSADLNNYSPWHFDNLSSPSQIKWNWNDVRDRIDQFRNTPEIKDASMARNVAWNIGSVLHTVQDFYAHSNWVEYWNEKGKYGSDIPTYFNKEAKIGDKEALFTDTWPNNPKCPRSHDKVNKDSPVKWNPKDKRSKDTIEKLWSDAMAAAQKATDEALADIMNNLGENNMRALKEFGGESSKDRNSYNSYVQQFRNTKFYD